MSEIDFLRKPTDLRLRKEVQNICDSYSHPWDLLAELCQNAVDAVRLHKERYGQNASQHDIRITINTRKREITVRDTGIGFDGSNVADLLAPHGTDKDAHDVRIIGQKGVGLTYVIFMCDEFSLTRRSESGAFSGTITQASSWRRGKNDSVPKLNVSEQKAAKTKPAETFTEVSVRWIEEGYADESEDIFSQSDAVLELLLRTKTAIGSTAAAFGDDDEGNLNVTLSVQRAAGRPAKLDITPTFLLPELLIKRDQVVDLSDFEKQASKLNDKQKTQRLQGKCLRIRGSVNRSGRTIKYYGFYVPSRRTWEEISTKNHLARPDGDSNEDQMPMYYGGIYIATRRMPTGIELSHPVTGSAGYWANNFILLEDNSLTFDLGRKSVPSRTQGVLKEIAKKLFQDFRAWSGYLTTDPDVSGKLANVASYEKFKTSMSSKPCPILAFQTFLTSSTPTTRRLPSQRCFISLSGRNI